LKLLYSPQSPPTHQLALSSGGERPQHHLRTFVRSPTYTATTQDAYGHRHSLSRPRFGPYLGVVTDQGLSLKGIIERKVRSKLYKVA
jgi:hypothetical protein